MSLSPQPRPGACIPLLGAALNEFKSALHDAQIVFSSDDLRFPVSDGWEVLGPLRVKATALEGDAVHIFFSARTSTRNSFDLAVQASTDKQPSVNYNLSEVSLSAAQITADNTPVVIGEIEGEKSITIHGLKKECPYLLFFEEGERKPIARPPQVGLHLRAQITEETDSQPPPLAPRASGVSSSALVGSSSIKS